CVGETLAAAPSVLPMSSEPAPRPPSSRQLTASLVAGGLLAVILAGVALGLAVALLLGAGLALVAVIALTWQSLQQMSGETELTFEEALSLAAPTTEEEQKRAALRALK